MKIIAVLLIYLLCFQSASWAQKQAGDLPSTPCFMLNRRFPGWKFADVSEEVRQFFETDMKGSSPHLISGDFDGNGQPDYATLIWRGKVRNGEGKAIGPRSFLVVFLRKGRGYR